MRLDHNSLQSQTLVLGFVLNILVIIVALYLYHGYVLEQCPLPLR